MYSKNYFLTYTTYIVELELELEQHLSDWLEDLNKPKQQDNPKKIKFINYFDDFRICVCV